MTKNLKYVKVCYKEENKFPVTTVQKVTGSNNMLSASEDQKSGKTFKWEE